MQALSTFDNSKIEEFLKNKTHSTESVYRAGLLTFQDFYKEKCKGSIADFLDVLQANKNLGWRESEDVATKVIKNYITWLRDEKGFSRKTIRVYVASVQQLAKKLHVPFQTNDVGLPVSNPNLKKYCWTLPDVIRFFDLFDSQMYRSLGVMIFQSFIDCSTALSLQYGDIRKELEAGIVPLCLDTERIKTDIPFYTFIGKWGVAELKKWLDSRDDLTDESPLFLTSKVPVCSYFRKRAEVFLDIKFKETERSPCGTHSLRAGGSTLARDSTCGSIEQVRAVDRYIDFFMGKTVEEQKRVYMSKTKEGWRITWLKCIEPFVTPTSSIQ